MAAYYIVNASSSFHLKMGERYTGADTSHLEKSTCQEGMTLIRLNKAVYMSVKLVTLMVYFHILYLRQMSLCTIIINVIFYEGEGGGKKLSLP